jgi:hypothetical protein
MIYINGFPLVDLPGFRNELHLSDSGNCWKSIIAMYYEQAPSINEEVLLQVRNLNYQKEVEEDPAGPDNEAEGFPFYVYEQMFVVENKYTHERPLVPQRDEFGEIIYDDDDEIVYEDNAPMPTVVVLEIREIKYVMDRQFVEKSLFRLPGVSAALDQIFEVAYDIITWDAFKELFTNNKFFFDDETVQPFPALCPEELRWYQRTKLDCIHEFCYAMGYRVLIKPVRISEEIEGETVTTIKNEILFKKRTRIRKWDEIRYEKLLWPIMDEMYIQKEEEVVVLSPYYGSYVNIVDSQVQEILDAARINIYCNASFETHYLPPEYFYEGQWSKLSIVFSGGDLKYVVQHFDRKMQYPKVALDYDQNYYVVKMRGYVESMTDDYMHLVDVIRADGESITDSLLVDTDNLSGSFNLDLTKQVPSIVEISVAPTGRVSVETVESRTPLARQMTFEGDPLEYLKFERAIPNPLPSDLFHNGNIKYSYFVSDGYDQPLYVYSVPSAGAYRKGVNPDPSYTGDNLPEAITFNLTMTSTDAEIGSYIDTLYTGTSYNSADNPDYHALLIGFFKDYYSTLQIKVPYAIVNNKLTFNNKEYSSSPNRFFLPYELDSVSGLLAGVVTAGTGVTPKPSLTIQNTTKESYATAWATYIANYFNSFTHTLTGVLE